MFAGWNKKPNVVIRKETMRLPSKPAQAIPRPQAIQRSSSSATQFQSRTTSSGSIKPGSGASRLRTSQLRKAQKRKSESPAPSRLESDSEDDDYSSSIPTPPPHKRMRASNGYVIDRKGQIRDKHFNTPLKHSLINGSDLTKGNTAQMPADPSPGHEDSMIKITLSYPGTAQQESFCLVEPKESDGYKPLEDVVESIETILKHYLPASIASPHLDESSGYRRRIVRAWTRKEAGALRSAIQEYNGLIISAREDGTIAKQLDSMAQIPENVLKYLLNQVYARTVSPSVELLRQYEAASNNVYGELLPPFASQIFRDTRMTPDSVFLDLGSGVGNVVLQAALEVGCTAHGIEMMENACVAARAQESEFKARCQLWGLSRGRTHLLQGDFLRDPRVHDILKRADVVLVNNQAFQPELYDALKIMFLDMKEGARLVSLKTFVNDDLKERNANDVMAAFEAERKSFYHNWVSWMGGGGDYFVATKDSAGIERRLQEKRRTH